MSCALTPYYFKYLAFVWMLWKDEELLHIVENDGDCKVMFMLLGICVYGF